MTTGDERVARALEIKAQRDTLARLEAESWAECPQCTQQVEIAGGVYLEHLERPTDNVCPAVGERVGWMPDWRKEDE